MWWKRKPEPNAICPYCLSLTTIEPWSEVVCGFCESELMRGMNFFIPLSQYLQKHSLEELLTQLQQTEERKKTAPKQQQFYYKDAIRGLKEVIALKKRSIDQ